MELHRRDFFLLLGGALLQPATGRTKRDMLVRSARPQDLEMPLSGFSDYITPVDHFFVRTHVYTPRVTLNEWRFVIDGAVVTPLTLTMDDVRRLPAVELVSVLECAGNGRGFYEPSVPGLQWTNGAVGNGRWRGVRLADVLKRAGVKPSAKEILFGGADVPIGTMPDFQRSIPVAKALDADTLLAYEMNGETLPVEHGFPLRVVVPGWAGDCWIKWLTSISVLDSEHDGFWMARAYRHPGRPVQPGTPIPPERMQPVTSLRIKSVIASPLDGSSVETGKPATIHGVAWSGDAGPVTRVDVSVDGGAPVGAGDAAARPAERIRLATVGLSLDPTAGGVLHDPGAGSGRGRQHAAIRSGMEPFGLWLECRTAGGRERGGDALRQHTADAAIRSRHDTTGCFEECLSDLS